MRNMLLLLLLAPFTLFAQQKSFVIKGILKGMPDKTELVLKMRSLVRILLLQAFQ